MKSFFDVSFSCVRRGILAVMVLCVLSIVVAAYAEPERYDFPKEEPVKFVTPAMPKVEEFTTEKQEARKIRKINEAKRQSIAALLLKYNRKLGDKKSYDYANWIIQASDKFGQNPFVIAAMVVLESSARNDAVSRGGDYGLMQVRWRVHQKKIRNKYPHIETARDMFNPKDNLLVGTEIFSTYHATANQDVRGALMYYTAGNKRMADKVFTILAQLEESYAERLKNS